MADNTTDVFAEFEDLLAELPPVPEDRPMMALTEIREYREKQREEEMKKLNNASSQSTNDPKGETPEETSSATEKMDRSSKKKFTDHDISEFHDVFSCVNQTTQDFGTQTVRLYIPDVQILATLSNCINKRIALSDIIHNILSLYLEQNKDKVKETLSNKFANYTK
ncbi:MAG: hypothetical protein KBT22_07910 [Bacteroidales bacterium]|nr:hypothetical protein [Candidatus Scybalocola fimicaballi]MCQ2189500.1 hypothetical protein [Paludibacteraceae bacterium]MCQ2191009.1 hypothetical protein [Paludibacteraceae bacterium]